MLSGVVVSGMTPLCSAVVNNYEGIASVLMSRGGAGVNVCDRSGSLPLHYAVRNGNLSLASALLAAGLCVFIYDEGFFVCSHKKLLQFEKHLTLKRIVCIFGIHEVTYSSYCWCACVNIHPFVGIFDSFNH